MRKQIVRKVAVMRSNEKKSIIKEETNGVREKLREWLQQKMILNLTKLNN